MKSAINNLLIALVVCLIAVYIGPIRMEIGGVKVTILPIIWAILISTLISPYLIGRYVPFMWRIITPSQVHKAATMLAITLYPLGVLFGIYAGPRLGIILDAGPALLLQEFGNTLTMLIALPLGICMGLGRAAFGGTFSLCRDTALGIIGDRYGLDSTEGMGTLGVYVFGSVFGTLIFALLAPLGLGLGYHPFALAMASGMGSGSMMGAATAALVDSAPAALSKEIMAYSATSGLLTAVFGVYGELFIALPLANFYYKHMHGVCMRLRVRLLGERGAIELGSTTPSSTKHTPDTLDATLKEAGNIEAALASGQVAKSEAHEEARLFSKTTSRGGLAKNAQGIERKTDSTKATKGTQGIESEIHSTKATKATTSKVDSTKTTARTIIDQIAIVLCVYAIVFACQMLALGTSTEAVLRGMFFSLLIVAPSIVIKNLVRQPNLPGFAWSTLIAAVLTLPFMPTRELIVDSVGAVDFTMTAMPLLAFAGISIADKLASLRQMSFKVAIIALIVMSSTYFGSATIAQIVLRLNHLI